MIRLGYACQNTQLPTAGRTFRLARYTDELMLECTRGNLDALLGILRWNAEQGIEVFRVTSQLVPFGSHPVNAGAWRTELTREFAAVGAFAREHGMRLSMHPGQYTVLNSPSEDVYASAVADLAYHAAAMELLGYGPEGRILLHCGGAYGDPAGSLAVLESRFRELPEPIASRLALENDEKVCSAEIVRVCERLGVPGVFDVFHHRVLASMPGLTDRAIVELFAQTWPAGERQKLHYSDQHPEKPRGAHSDHIDVEAFARFAGELSGLEVDVMLEVKDKERSVLAAREVLG